MKIKYITLIITFLIFGKICAQNTVSDLQNFAKSADMNCYLNRIKKNISDCHKAQCEFFKVPETTNSSKIEFLNGKTVPMLTIQFVNMEKFDLSQDVYSHITLDSTRVFTLACVDNNMNVLVFANYYDGTYAYSEVKAEHPDQIVKLEQVIITSTAMSQKPSCFAIP